MLYSTTGQQLWNTPMWCLLQRSRGVTPTHLHGVEHSLFLITSWHFSNTMSTVVRVAHCAKRTGIQEPQAREQPQVRPSSKDAVWLLPTHKLLIPVRHLPENQQGMSWCLEVTESGDWISQQEHKPKLDRWYPHGEKLPSKIALCKGEDVSWSPVKLCNQIVIFYVLLAS